MRRCFSSRLCSNGCRSLSDGEALVNLLRQDQRRAAGQEARACRALAARRGVDLDDLLQRAVIAGRVALALIDPGDLEVRLDGRFDRLRELLHVALVHSQRAVGTARFLVQLAGEQQRFGAQLAIVRLDGNALVLFGGTRQLSRLAIDERDLLRRFALQLMLGIGGAERVEHGGRRGPVFQPDQRSTRVVLRAGADLRRRRDRLDAQEVIGRGAIVRRLVRALALLVDRRGEVLDQTLRATRLPPG